MKVLLGIDHPGTLGQITSFAQKLHWLENADVKVACVMAPIIFPEGTWPAVSPEMIQGMYDDAKRVLHTAADKLELEIGRRPALSMPFGDPAQSLVDEAKKWNADLIVVAPHAGRWERLFLGSVSNYVAEHAQCPVLILRNGTSTSAAAAGDALHKDMMFCSQCSQSFLDANPQSARCPFCKNADQSTLRVIYREDDPAREQLLTVGDWNAGD
jgi:nucleotide-binding universal stress UspA family protein